MFFRRNTFQVEAQCVPSEVRAGLQQSSSNGLGPVVLAHSDWVGRQARVVRSEPPEYYVRNCTDKVEGVYHRGGVHLPLGTSAVAQWCKVSPYTGGGACEGGTSTPVLAIAVGGGAGCAYA